MSTRRSDPSDSDIDEALQQFSQQLAALTDAVDRLCDELQWRNNELRHSGEPPSPPFVLHSMPIDPTTDDWHINRVRPGRPGKPPTPVGSQPDQEIVPLKREVADLQQFLAAVILMTACGDEPEFRDCETWLIEWASREFDPELLRLAMPAVIVDAVAPTISCVPQRSDHQRQLFEKGDADADRSDG